jgi:hypothetical protein
MGADSQRKVLQIFEPEGQFDFLSAGPPSSLTFEEIPDHQSTKLLGVRKWCKVMGAQTDALLSQGPQREADVREWT